MTGGDDLVVQRRDGQLPDGLRQPPDAAVATAVPERSPRRAVVGRQGEHRPSRLIEVSGQDVDHVHQPGGRGPEGHGAGPEPPVDHRPLRVRELTGELPDRGRVDPTGSRHAFGREGRRRVEDLLEAGDVVGEVLSDVDEPLLGQGVHQREEEQRVAARSDGEVEIGTLRRAGADRVDHHQPASSAPQRRQASREVRGGQQRAVGDPRVAADDHQQIGPVDVRDGDRERVPEQLAAADVLGELVHARGRVHVRGAQRLDEGSGVELAGQGVRVRVAEVDGDRVVAVLGLDGVHALGDLGEGLGPARRDELAVPADPGCLQPVGVGLQLAERRPLRAQVPGAEHVVGIASDARDPVGLVQFDPQPTGRLAQRTGPEHGSGHGGLPRAATHRTVAVACMPVSAGAVRTPHRPDGVATLGRARPVTVR